jgi:hypothetical protein
MQRDHEATLRDCSLKEDLVILQSGKQFNGLHDFHLGSWG